MNAEIIAIGTEILLGHIVNSNSAYLSRKLAEAGIDVYYHSTVGDNPARLSAALKLAFSRSDLIFTTGGLGPTVDDITLSVICGVVSKNTFFEKTIMRDMIAYFRRKGLKKIPPDARRQAYVPEGSKWFRNTVGTAPGVLIGHGRRAVVALPGPPRELCPMFEESILPYLKKKGFAGDWVIKTRSVKTTGLVESVVNRKVRDLLAISGGATVGIYAHLGEVHLKITAKAENGKKADKLIRGLEKEIEKRLRPYIYGYDAESLEGVVGALLARKKKTISIAESCTGGLVASRVTDIGGSSNYFRMGVIAYSNRAKEKILSVSKKSLNKYGAVSRVVAEEMAEGIKKAADSDIGIGTTGIAGPGGATRKKPVGLVYISITAGKKKVTEERRFSGRREEIKHQASIAALDLIRRTV